VDTLHLSPTAARKLRDSLTLVLVEIEVATIEAAGLETETTSYPEALAIVHSVNETGRVSA